MEQAKHIDMQTPDGTGFTLDALYKIAPSCFTEAKGEDGELHHVVDFKKLRQLLGDAAVDDAPEVYDFTWVGKRAAMREAASPIKKTLRPCPEESVEWENTQNLYIEGDNLEVLKLLQNSYMGKVKMIYIDPPYNTGNDFVYHDDFSQSVDEYDEANRDDEGNRYRKNTNSNGRFHSDWCSMLYARLIIARNILSKDGIIFLSIDSTELSNLKKICDEVFSNENFLGQVVRRAKTTSFRGNFFAPRVDYLLVYSKSIDSINKFRGEVHEEQYNKIETIGPRKGERYGDDTAFYLSTLQTRPNQRYFIQCPDGELVIPPGKTIPPCKKDGEKVLPIEGDGVWRWEVNGYLNKKYMISFKETKTSPLLNQDGEKAHWNLYTKIYLNDKKDDANIPEELFLDFINRQSTKELGEIDIPFDFAKPVSLIKYLIKIIDKEDDIIVLDFFSGSATTAHAVMQLNAEDGGHRKFIMVQWPEETPADSEAAKAGYKNICEIGKKRILRAGKKIKSDTPLTTQGLDIGFRVFKCDESNYKDVAFSPKNYSQESLDMFVDNIKEDRSDLDLLFDCMLRWGVELSMPLKSTKVDGCTIHNVDDGNLVACFDGVVTEKVIDAIAAMSPVRVTFRDSSFTEAAAKMNLFELFKQKCGWSESEVKNNIRVI